MLCMYVSIYIYILYDTHIYIYIITISFNQTPSQVSCHLHNWEGRSEPCPF